MSKGEVNAKFKQFASAALDQRDIEAICEIVDALDSVTNIHEIIRLLVSREGSAC